MRVDAERAEACGQGAIAAPLEGRRVFHDRDTESRRKRNRVNTNAIDAFGAVIPSASSSSTANIFRLAFLRELRASVLKSIFLLAALALSGCGYHTSNSAAVQLPAGIQTVAIPVFENKTQSYRAEQVLSEAVVREFISQGRCKIVPSDDGSADAVLHGTVTGSTLSPLTFDQQTGRASTSTVQITVAVKLVDKHGKTLFDNPRYSFREVYQVSRDVTSFFDESPLAVDRLARDFAHSLVADILEGF
jgi:outer membrane lipopolysaccharide assembly protein LptE/RlpB